MAIDQVTLGHLKATEQRLQRLHDGSIVGSMHDRHGGVRDEIDEFGGRPAAVELGEIGIHPSPEGHSGEALAGRRIHRLERWSDGPFRVRLVGLHML